MFLLLGEAGISEIPNESAVLSAMQSNIGEQTGLYIFPRPGVVSCARAAVHDWQMLGIKFGTELLEAIVVVFLLAETGIAISDRRSLTAVF
jgi:hypothetical protein